MTSRLTKPGGESDLNSVRPQAGAGRFMVTLCTLDAPVSIRQSQSPHLRPFTFFVSRAYQADRTERLYLNMGYFNTLVDAEKWAEATRRQFPGAFATIASGAPSQPTGLETASSSPLGVHAPASGGREPEVVKLQSLTDSQVLKILETRGDPTIRDGADEACDQIELLRPDDTITRQIIKEAVVNDAPVWFAVQLQWSAQRIELGGVRSLPIFKSHTLYATVSRRHGRSRHFLRLGFFADPNSAKQVAVQMLSQFDSAAVVPVVEPEITRAREASAADVIPYLEESQVDQQGDSGSTEESSLPPPSSGVTPRRRRAGAKTVDGTVEAPGEGEMWGESDLLNDSGVRHLRVERQEHLSGRWKIIRLRGDSPNEAQLRA